MIRRQANTGGHFSMKSNKSSPVRVRIVVFFFVLAVIVGIGAVWWSERLQAVDPLDTIPVSFRVESGQSVRQIASNLAAERLIRSPTAFFVLVKLNGIDTDIQAGDFRLSRTMDARVVADRLTHGFEDVWVTTLEGWRSEEIASVLTKDLDIPATEFLKIAKEGYMFPDTYRVPRDASAGAVVNMFRSTFDGKIADEMSAAAARSGLTMDELVTLASIVEREGRTDTDRPVIAGILLKRLEADWPLQADATLQYALGYQPQEKTWWKNALMNQDKEIDSPYNTYINTGLPPGPISNPGISSLRAVAHPVETDYWYYIHDLSGAVHYAATLDEHNANVDRYLR